MRRRRSAKKSGQNRSLSYVTLRRELNEAEQANILAAEEWALARKRDVLSERFTNSEFLL